MDNIIDIQDLIQKICQLSYQEKQHILKFLIANNINFTKNINGYFFNLASHHVSENLLYELKTKIHLMEVHRNEIINVDTLRDNMIKQCKELIETNLQDSIKIKLDEYTNKIKLIKHDNNINISISKNVPKNIKKIIYYDKYDQINTKKTYNKNSIYYRILTKMKILASRKKEKNHDHYEDYNDYNENDFNDNPDNDIDVDIEQEIDDTVIIDDDIDNIDNIDHTDNDDENNIDNDSLYDSESEFENKIKIENEKSYYKKLLNNHGFKFDNDKSCLLIYQEYID